MKTLIFLSGIALAACSLSSENSPENPSPASGDDAGRGKFPRDGGAPNDGPQAASSPFVIGYYPGYKANELPVATFDFSPTTHVVHAALIPSADGAIVRTANGLSVAASKSFVTAVHNAGKKALISIGGAVPKGQFETAAKDATRPKLIAELVAYMDEFGYDGIDVDWEPIPEPALFQSFVRELSAILKSRADTPLLFCASPGPASTLAPVADVFDQLNIMTYDMSGPFPGWVTWHNSPLFSGGATFPGSARALPSIDSTIAEYIKLGVPAAKLGIGVPFYSYVWKGVSEPRQSWTTKPVVERLSYRDTISQFATATSSWDDAAKTAFISIDLPGTADDRFISTENQQSITEKAAYVRAKGLGGVIVWELAQGHIPSAPKGQQDPLLTTLARELGVK